MIFDSVLCCGVGYPVKAGATNIGEFFGCAFGSVIGECATTLVRRFECLEVTERSWAWEEASLDALDDLEVGDRREVAADAFEIVCRSFQIRVLV